MNRECSQERKKITSRVQKYYLYSGFSFLITFVSDMKLREKCRCFKIYLESEGGNQEKNSIQKSKLSQFNASRGIEREVVLRKGDIWIRPTICMELKTMYNRNRQKKETRQMVLEYEEV